MYDDKLFIIIWYTNISRRVHNTLLKSETKYSLCVGVKKKRQAHSDWFILLVAVSNHTFISKLSVSWRDIQYDSRLRMMRSVWVWMDSIPIMLMSVMLWLLLLKWWTMGRLSCCFWYLILFLWSACIVYLTFYQHIATDILYMWSGKLARMIYNQCEW